ncbi:MAG TPA: hypothetical protein VJV78_29445 [Polyangiales bacterium]|nr:hypothetical protein [Polyangiales bacterium]
MGSCRKVSIPFVTDGAGVRHYLAKGTAGDDIMLVYDTGAPSVNWCGFTGIRPLAAPPNRGVIHVAGGLGSDTIWGGNGGGAVVIASIWGSDSRFGPAAEIESNLETKGPVNDACNLTYIAVYQKVLGMLAN